MIRHLLMAIIIPLISLNYACKPSKRECFLSYTPELHFVGFDSNDFKDFLLEKYSTCCDFDSLLDIDTLSFYSQDLTTQNDTITIVGLYFPSAPIYYSNPHFNWIITFANNVRINISNCSHENNKCVIDPPGSYDACICNLKDYEINTQNCSLVFDNNIVYIEK